MRVMVVESHQGAGRSLADGLRGRGHEVLTCHQEGVEHAGCRALDPADGCPLDTGTVDVAVDVRRSYHPSPRPREQGAICAVRSRVPVIISGVATDSSMEPWATDVVVGDVPAVIDAVEAVDGSVAPMHQRVVDEALERVLPGQGATAVVRRGEDQVGVELSLPRGLAAADAEKVAVRIVAALRAFDAQTAVFDVSSTAPERPLA